MSSLFTKIINREIQADIVYEDDRVIAFLDIKPVKKGHTLVVPKKEFVNIFDGDADTLGYMMQIGQKIGIALVASLGARGVNFHMNNGEEAGQEVPHAHLHVIPRFDRNEAFPPAPHEVYADGECKIVTEKIKQSLL